MKITLILISAAVLVMGILGAIPGITMGSEPIWHAILKIVAGIIGLYVALKN
ncbi:hypothetical protein ACFLTO_03945 [Chloroflexota bacterium]